MKTAEDWFEDEEWVKTRDFHKLVTAIQADARRMGAEVAIREIEARADYEFTVNDRALTAGVLRALAQKIRALIAEDSDG